MDLKFMYVLVMFDLPTQSKKDIKRYTKFRNTIKVVGTTCEEHKQVKHMLFF
jgi:CRISPR-associated endonuclease Cas2